MRPTAVVALVAAGLLATGCILKDTHHTLLVDADGGVTWVVVERNARSNAPDRADRDQEEAAFLDALEAGEHDVARALARAGASAVDSRLARCRRPYAVWTEARFASAEAMVEALLAELDLGGHASLTRDGDRFCFDLVVSIPEDSEDSASAAGGDGDDETVLALLDGIERLEVVLLDGRFTGATGFEVDGDRAVPVPLSEEEVEAAGGTVRFSLEWELDPSPAG